MPVARFRANVFIIKDMGRFEFANESVSEELREEIVVTGLTVFFAMLMRCSSVFSVVGALFHRTGAQKVEGVGVGGVTEGEHTGIVSGSEVRDGDTELRVRRVK